MGRLKNTELVATERQRRAATLGDMAAQALDIFCWCNRCGHNGTLATADLIAKLGAAVPVPEVGGCLRCSRCRGKDIATRPNWRGLGTVTRHAPLGEAATHAAGTAPDVEGAERAADADRKESFETPETPSEAVPDEYRRTSEDD